jgi:hypothetical protein
LGQGSSRRMDSSGRRRGWASLSVRESQGLDLGQRHHRKGHLAHCESQRKARRHSTTRAPRLSSVLRALVSCGRRRVGADPIPVGHVSVETTERYLGCKQRLRQAVNDKIGLEP